MTIIKNIMPPPPAGRSQLGLSLVELMVSLTIGLILLAGITGLIVRQNSTRDELEKSSRQIENGRYATQILHEDIQHAGFYGQYFNLPAPGASLPDPCDTSLTNMDAAMSLPIQGYLNALPTASFSCALDGADASKNAQNYVAGTDILVIRRAETTITPLASVTSGRIYLQSTTSSHVLGNGSDTSVFTLTTTTTSGGTSVASLRAYDTHIYFISPCSVPAGGGTSCTGAGDDNGRPIPTLKRLDLSSVGSAPTFTVTPLVEGIENLQLDFGIDADGDGAPDSYATAPATTADWANVMAVRLNLLARNTECTAGYSDPKTYNLGISAGSVSPPASNCPNGGYKRHVYTELVRAVNPSGRREK